MKKRYSVAIVTNTLTGEVYETVITKKEYINKPSHIDLELHCEDNDKKFLTWLLSSRRCLKVDTYGNCDPKIVLPSERNSL